MTGTYGNLHLTILLREADRRQHTDYKYLVANEFAHTAYATRAGLIQFLRDTGLRIGKRRYWGRSVELLGSYRQVMMNDEARFARMKKSGKYRISDWMSNGDFTTALIGCGVVYYLSPNCKREVLPYRWD